VELFFEKTSKNYLPAIASCRGRTIRNPHQSSFTLKIAEVNCLSSSCHKSLLASVNYFLMHRRSLEPSTPDSARWLPSPALPSRSAPKSST